MAKEFFQVMIECGECGQSLPLADIWFGLKGTVLLIVQCNQCKLTTRQEATLRQIIGQCRQAEAEDQTTNDLATMEVVVRTQ